MTAYKWTALEERGPQEPQKKRARLPGLNSLVVRHVGISVGVSLLLVGVFSAAGMAPRPLWFVATALAVGFGSVAIRLLVPQVLETNWPGRHDELLAALRTRSNDNRTQFIATWLQESDRERRAGPQSQTFVRRIQPLLLELTTDRLVRRHGIDPRLEPERARELVGDHVWTMITSRQTASIGEIEAAVQTIEKL